jgi:two-component system, chemotaxis family, chemotaxis protein CheY
MKALIVDDNLVDRELMRTIVSLRCDCSVAANGAEAVQAFRTALDRGEPFDLVFMDIGMPVMDGHEALARIRDIEQESGIEGSAGTRAIMTTALDDPRNVVQALFEGGATSYLVKPIDRERVLDELRRIEASVRDVR